MILPEKRQKITDKNDGQLVPYFLQFLLETVHIFSTIQYVHRWTKLRLADRHKDIFDLTSEMR